MKKKMVEEEKCSYNGAIVLGLNDALVELSGALVGLSFAFVETKLIGKVGLITGFAAALSMAASEYLSAKEDSVRKPAKAALYTGMAYLIAVLVLVTPYFVISSTYVATAIMFAFVVGVIAIYTGYVSNINKTSFKSKFGEMFVITLGVSVISFFFGNLIKNLI